MVKIWGEQIALLDVIDTGALYRSTVGISMTVVGKFIDIPLKQAFNIYGIFVDFLLQQFSIVVAAFQYAHLMNGDLVQLHKPLALRHTLPDENRIEVLQIRQADKFVDCGVVVYVTFEVWIGFTPLFCRYTEHRHIQNIGFIGVDNT